MSGQEIKCPVCGRIPKEIAWQNYKLWTVALTCNADGRTPFHHHSISISETSANKAKARANARAAWVRAFGQKEGGLA